MNYLLQCCCNNNNICQKNYSTYCYVVYVDVYYREDQPVHEDKTKKTRFIITHRTSYISSTLRNRNPTPGKLLYTYFSSVPPSASPPIELILTACTKIPKCYANNRILVPYTLESLYQEKFRTLIFFCPSIGISSNQINSDTPYNSCLKLQYYKSVLNCHRESSCTLRVTQKCTSENH